MNKITMFKFRYTPMNKAFPIRIAELIIIAESKEEAQAIALENDYKFFDQDLAVEIDEVLLGFKIDSIQEEKI